jgi:hypothetical protein
LTVSTTNPEAPKYNKIYLDKKYINCIISINNLALKDRVMVPIGMDCMPV